MFICLYFYSIAELCKDTNAIQTLLSLKEVVLTLDLILMVFGN